MSVTRIMWSASKKAHRELRHHLAMLRKCQRCLHLMDHKDVSVEEIRRSIDFVVEYAKKNCK